MLKIKLQNRFWWFGLLSITFMAVAFYLILTRGWSMSITNQYLLQEKTISRAIARNFEGFFQVLGRSTAFRAGLSNKENWNSETQKDMNEFVDQWRDSGLVSGVILADAKGIVKINSNTRGVSDVGASIADRDYFIWAKTQTKSGKYYIGQPIISRLGASKDQLIVPVVSPIFIDATFKGVLSTAIKLEPLTERFLDNMKVSKESRVYLIDENEDVLYKNPGSPDLDKSLVYWLESNQVDRFKRNGLLVAYSTANLGDRKWRVVLTSPVKELLSYTIPFYIRQILVLFLISLMTLIFGVVVSRKR